jgi:hypothetical protein
MKNEQTLIKQASRTFRENHVHLGFALNYKPILQNNFSPPISGHSSGFLPGAKMSLLPPAATQDGDHRPELPLAVNPDIPGFTVFGNNHCNSIFLYFSFLCNFRDFTVFSFMAKNIPRFSHHFGNDKPYFAIIRT